ncbi:MAG TPA: histidine kinase [Mycobacteriales bacterium]
MLVDLLLAAVGVVSVVPNLSGDPGLLPLVALVVAPLVVRRRWPVPVFGWVLAGSALLGLGSPYAVPGLAVLIALYTVASSRPLPVALTAAAGLEAGVVVAAVRQPGPWVTPAVFLTGMLVAALGLGLYVAAHRELVAGLRDRTAALERERDTAAALAAAAERARIARELHDIVAHHLTVMVALSDGAAAVEPAGAEAMRMVAATGRQALAETRRAVGVSRAPLHPGLHAAPLDPRAQLDPRAEPGVLAGLDGRAGLGAAELDPGPGLDPPGPDPRPALGPLPGIGDLTGLVAGVEAAGLATTLDVAGPVASLPDGVQLAAYRVVQEALTNTLKHAGPGARASVRLSTTPAEVRIDVTDTGSGTPGGMGGGSGLVGMGERVGAYGGSLRSGPRPGGGWQVAASLPVGR